MTSEGHNLMDKMLSQLVSAKRSMEQQSRLIAEVTEKSNNIILQIETSKATITRNVLANSNRSQPYCCNKETLQLLAKILEQFKSLSQKQSNELEDGDKFQSYIKKNQQMTEFLGSNVRKLVAAGDQIAKICNFLKEDWEEGQQNEEEHTDSNDSLLSPF